MNSKKLKDKLIESLGKIYYMEAFSHLTEFLQGELYVLHFLFVNKDMAINPSILSERLHMSRPRITAALSNLRRKGYVVTKISAHDRRKVLVMLTPEGHSYIVEKQRNVETSFEMFVNGIGEKNALELIRIIDLTASIMDSNDKENELTRIGELK